MPRPVGVRHKHPSVYIARPRNGIQPGYPRLGAIAEPGYVYTGYAYTWHLQAGFRPRPPLLLLPLAII